MLTIRGIDKFLTRQCLADEIALFLCFSLSIWHQRYEMITKYILIWLITHPKCFVFPLGISWFGGDNRVSRATPPATTSLISDTFITFLCTTAHWHNCTTAHWHNCTNTHLHIWTSSHLLCTIYFICAECDCWWLCSSPPYTALLRALIMVIMTLEPMSRSTLVPIALLSPEWLCQVIRTLLMSPLNRCLRLERGSRWQFNETYLRLSLPLGQTAIFAKVPATFLIIRTGRPSIKYHFRYFLVEDI